MLKLIMVLLWMILLEVLLCAEAENVTEVRGQLGTEVTLICSHQSSDTYWYMKIHSQFRAYIGRSFSSVPTYSSPDFETKFSLLGTQLLIKNLTAEDCRLYFCGIRRGGRIQFVDSFRLVSTVPPPTSVITGQLALIISVAVSGVIILIMGGVLILLCLRRKTSSKQVEDPSVHIYENAEVLWAMQGKVIQHQAKRH